jgi:methionyl-tRNA formyltransferase
MALLTFQPIAHKKIKLKVKALDPWPSGHCQIDGKFLKIFSVEDSTQTIKPGVMVNYHGQLHVGCSDGSLRLIELQIEGKKRTSDFDFLKGYKGELKL